MAKLRGVAGTGHISYGPRTEDRIVKCTMDFIRSQLPAWRDHPDRPRGTAEPRMNSALCDFLEVESRSSFPMVYFKHESLQTGRHSADIGVHGAEEIKVRGWKYSIYEPFLVVECKRLPTPGPSREREYVTGHSASGSPSGGIQRFKLGLHGRDVNDGAIVGYIESGDAHYWYSQINGWLGELYDGANDDGTKWESSERLQDFTTDNKDTASCNSVHPRTADCRSPVIHLRHIWVIMNPT